MNLSGWSYKKKVLALTIGIGLLRLILAFVIELGNDESYYWLYSQHLKSNYFDHPPMIALWIRLTTLNLSLQNYPGFIRLGCVISCSLATWFMYKCVAALTTERAGWFAACLYNGFFYTGVTAGIFAFPDAPQMLFWTLSMYLIVRITQDEKSLKYWLLFGIASGLCIMSKIHGLFIWIGLGYYIIFYKRSWIRNVRLYVAIAISIGICLPILFWNIHYNFLTFKFNGPRVSFDEHTIGWKYFLNELNNQTFKNNPLNVLFIVLGLFALKKRRIQYSPALTIFNFAGILHISILLFVSLFKLTLAHWSGPAYVSLLPIGAIYLDTKIKKKPQLLAGLSVAIHVCVLLFCAWFINYFPGTYGVHSGRYIGLSDFSLDLYAWKSSGEKFDSIYLSYQQKNIVPANTPVICNGWWGAHLEYYFCRPQHINMIGLSDIMDIHEYAWMNNMRKDSVNMQQAFCIVPSIGYYNIRKTYRPYYSHADSIATIQVSRGNKPAQNFYVYLLSGWKGKMPLEQ